MEDMALFQMYQVDEVEGELVYALIWVGEFKRCREEVEVTSKGVLYSDCAANGIQMRNNQFQIMLFSDNFMMTRVYMLVTKTLTAIE